MNNTRMSTAQKILLIIGTVAAIIFILYGVPRIGTMLEPKLGFNPKVWLWLLCAFVLFVIGRAQGGGEYNKLNKEFRSLDRELIHQHRIDYYIIQNKRLYKETKDPRYRAICLSNIAMGYHHDGKYDQADNVISKINFDDLNEGQRVTLYNQQFMDAIYGRHFDRAGEIYETHKTIFTEYEGRKEYHNHYLCCRLYYELCTTKKGDKEALAKIREEFNTIKVSQKAYPKAYNYRLLEGRLLMAEGERQEGKENLQLLLKEYLMPGFKREVTWVIKNA